MNVHQEWKVKIMTRDVIIRVRSEQPPHGTLVGFYVVNGPSRDYLNVAVTSPQDAEEKVRAMLAELMGPNWP